MGSTMRRTVLAACLLALLLPFSAAFGQAPPAVPALPDSERRTAYTISSSTCACNVNFALYGDGTDIDAWIEVWINNVQYLSTDLTHGWSLSSATGSLATIPRPITDAVLTFNAAQTGTVQIVGARRPRRLTQFTEGRGVAARDLNQVLTDLTAENRETWDKINDVTGRGFFAPPGLTGGIISGFTTGVFGPVSSTANDIAIFNGSSGAAIADAGGGIPSLPVIHPSSGNLIGAGCATAHQAWWVDQNFCAGGDHYQFQSSDPSALMQLTIGGTVTTGDQITLTFKFGSGACISSGSGCSVSYTTIGGDTTTKIAEALSCAIANSANLFTINGGTCANGVITPPASGQYGGYATSQIGYVVANATNVVSLDFNSTVNMKLTTSVSGSATETVTISNSSCGTVCSNAWDGAPGFNVIHFVSGIAPAATSNIGAFSFESNNSALLTGVNTTYAQIGAQVSNSTSGALQGRLALTTPDVNGNLNQGVYIGNGFYTVGTTDKGLDTINAKQSWINSAYEISQSSSTFRFDTLSTNHPIVFNSGGGYGFGQVPTAADTELGTNLSVFGNTGTPTTGTGWGFFGGTPAQSFCINYATGVQQPCKFNGSSFDFEPSGSTTSGWTLSANSLVPDGDNVTVLGSGAKRISSLTTQAATIVGLSTQGQVCNSAAGLLSTSITWCAGATPARNQTLPGNPTGTTSSTPVMAGLSNGVTRFTPVTSGNMLFTISGTAQNTNSGNGCVVIIRYGTGNGPANAASSTGTTAGATSGQQATSNSAGGNVPFSITAYVTGLTLSTAYYYDLAFNAVTGGTCSLTNITMTAMEM